LFDNFQLFRKSIQIFQTLTIKVITNLIQNQIVHYNRKNIVGVAVQILGTTTEQIITAYILTNLGMPIKIIGIILIFL